MFFRNDREDDKVCVIVHWGFSCCPGSFSGGRICQLLYAGGLDRNYSYYSMVWYQYYLPVTGGATRKPAVNRQQTKGCHRLSIRIRIHLVGIETYHAQTEIPVISYRQKGKP